MPSLPGFFQRQQAMLGAIPTLTQGQALHSTHFTLQGVRALWRAQESQPTAGSSLPAHAGTASALQCSCKLCSTAVKAAVNCWEFTPFHPSFRRNINILASVTIDFLFPSCIS